MSPGAAAGAVATGADPKDKIAEFRTLSGLMREGLTALRQKQYAQSVARFTRLQAAGADSFQLHFYLGQALTGLGRGRDAERSFERAVAAMPSFTQAHLALADARIARKDYQGAIAALQRGHRQAPNEPMLYDREGQVWQQLGDRARARAAWDRVAALAPRDGLVRWRLGELAIAAGEPDRALTLFREATALAPGEGDYWNSLGMVLGGQGANAEAAAAFRTAIARNSSNARFAYNLGLVLMRDGDAEAARWFERALAIDPRFRPARERLAELGR